MSLKSHIQDMLNTSSDSQLLSFRSPETTVNKLDEWGQIFGKTRTELITAFIDGGLAELERQYKDGDLPIETRDLSLGQSKSNKTRYFLLNTNYNNSADDHYTMLKNGEASAFYGNWKENISYLSKGDVVFLYQSGVGIVGYGKADGKLIKRNHDGNVDEWYSQKLQEFKRLKKPLTAKGCKDVTKSNFNFRMTMVSLSDAQGEALMKCFASE